MDLRDYIRDVPNFPKPPILFRDITPLMGDAAAFRFAIDQLAERCAGMSPDVLVSVEARGFLLAAPLAYRMGKPLAPARKPGKLPAAAHRVEYALEYGDDALEIHADAIAAGQRALIVDDLLATGGTAAAAAALVGRCGGKVAGYAFLVELAGLRGRERLGGAAAVSLVEYP